MPDDDYEPVLDGFIAELNQAWHAAGTPSYSKLEQVSLRLRANPGAVKVDVLARSTAQEILTGHRQHPPRWTWVVSFVTVLRTVAQDNGVAVGKIGTVDAWKRKHDRVRVAAEQAARRPASVGGRHRKRPAKDNAIERQWWHRYRDVAPDWLEFYLYLESAAEVVRTYQPRLIPGLLQVEPYARAMLARSHPESSESEITRLVELRMRRQELLGKPRSLQLWAIFDEAALRNEQVDAQAMRSQITHLINISEQPNVTLQVLPSQGLDDHVAIKEPITIFRFPEEHLGDVVFLERPRGEVFFLTGRKEAEHYSQLMSRLAMRSGAVDGTRRLLRMIFTEL